MSQIIPIYIPTYINSEQYAPARVLPRLFFYNGLLECETYYIQDGNGAVRNQNVFPYFDNYNVVSGSFPTTGSLSLLFNNENASYGTIPNQNLYTQYWETYINLLYNPKTRLLECSAIIPLADYVTMELNDIVNFRGNYYHLRAINDYSLKTGECNLQLLGPIIPDTFTARYPVPPSIPSASALINLSEYNASPTAFLDANIIVSGSPYYFSGNFTQTITGNTTANVTLEGKDGGSTVWGPYTTASATLTVLDNGVFVTSSTQYIYSGSGDINIIFPTTFTAGHTITISGSTAPVSGPTPPPTGSATLAWTFTETGGALGQMDLYVNGNVIESRGNTSSGTHTVYVGDTINVGVTAQGCGGFDDYANAYCSGIINDADCVIDDIASIFTSVYTVQLADVGTTLNLNNFAACDGGCL
jgi:hypothetical protein